MADLDDFFAKKDRSKKSKVKKFATADELAKKLDDPKPKSEVRPKKERPVQEGEEAGGRGGQEEEWKEYEEPIKDYTGLKIQVLQGGIGVPDSGREYSMEDQSGIDSGKIKGPWKKPVEAETPVAPPVMEEKPRESKPSTYVPPSSRARPLENPRRNQHKHAPDIHNDDYFPVLGASAKRGGGGGWSTAGAGTPGRGTGHARQPLALGNSFTELQDDS